MKREEEEYLGMLKHQDGLDDEEVWGEMQFYKDSQKGFKILKRELKKKDTAIKNLQKKIDKLKSKLLGSKRVKSKVPKQAIPKSNSNLGKDIFEKDISKEEKEKLKRYKKYANRMRQNMNPDQEYTKTEIIRQFMIPTYTFNWVINFLVKDNSIRIEETEDGPRYFKI